MAGATRGVDDSIDVPPNPENNTHQAGTIVLMRAMKGFLTQTVGLVAHSVFEMMPSPWSKQDGRP